MRLLWILLTLFFCGFYPKVLTDCLCFGSKRDKICIKSWKQYWLIFAINLLPFAFLCIVAGSDIGADDTLDNIFHYYRLTFGGEDYVGCSNRYAYEKILKKADNGKHKYYLYKTDFDDDDYKISIYYTRKPIDGNLIYKIVSLYYASDLKVVKTDKSHWAVYSGKEFLGYAESIGGFLFKKILVFMPWSTFYDKNKTPMTPEEIAEEVEKLHKYFDELEEKEKNKNIFDIIFDPDNSIKIELSFLIVLGVLILWDVLEKKKKDKENKNIIMGKDCNPNLAYSANALAVRHVDTDINTEEQKSGYPDFTQDNNAVKNTPMWKLPKPNENGESDGQAYTSRQWKPQAPTDKTAEQNKWNEANLKWNPDIPHTFNQKWNPQRENPESGQWEQTPVWEKDEGKP